MTSSDAHPKGCALIIKKYRFQAVRERVHRYKVRGCIVEYNFTVTMNIATTKLIQCRIAEMAENTAFLPLHRSERNIIFLCFYGGFYIWE